MLLRAKDTYLQQLPSQMTQVTKDRSFYLLAPLYVRNEKNSLGEGYFQTGTAFLVNRSRTGTSNPNWRYQVMNGQNATTPMNGTFDTYYSDWGEAWCRHYDINHPSDRTVYTDRVWGDIAYHCYPPRIDWSAILSSSVAYNRALIAYLKNIRETIVAFSGLTFIGELRETLRMIRRPAEGLANLAESYLHQVKKMKNAKPKNWKKNLSGLWLEQAFGWQPLINDIGRAYKLYAQKTVPDELRSVSGYGRDEKLYQLAQGLSNVGGKGSSGYRYQNRRYEVAQVKFRGKVKRSTSSTAGQYTTWGFEALEFVPTIWELLPWSFLIDYFSNIGDVITAGCAVTTDLAWSNLSVIRSQISETAADEDKTYTQQLHSGGWVASSGWSTFAQTKRRSVTRTVGVIPGNPYLSLEVPSRPWQWANMTALFAQATAIHPQHKPRTGRVFFPYLGHS